MNDLKHYSTTKHDEGEIIESTGEIMQIAKKYGVGIDTHSKFIYVSVICRINHELRRFDQTFDTSWNQLLAARAWIQQCLATKPVPALDEQDINQFHYTIESTSVYHFPIIRALEGRPCVVNPLLASPSRRKTDALDAKLLAYQNLTGLWPESYIVTDDITTVRILMAQRETHRSHAVKISNQINNYCLRYGCTIGRYGSVSASKYVRGIVEDKIGLVGNSDRDDICPDDFPPEAKETLKFMYEEYDRERKEQDNYMKKAIQKIKSMDWNLPEGELISGEKLLKLLITVPGIAETSAAIWLTNICDINRFPNSKAAAAFCGLDPSLKVSAGKVTSTVKRGGNKNLHTMLTNCASVLVRNANEPFGIWGRQMYTAHGKWRKACSAVARRLAVSLYWVHKKGVEFTYEGYKMNLKHKVIKIPLSELAIIAPEFKRYNKILLGNNISNTEQLVQAFDENNLKGVKGLGSTFFKYVHSFITNQKKYTTLYKELKGEDFDGVSERASQTEVQGGVSEPGGGNQD